jgi:hypothetical protein
MERYHHQEYRCNVDILHSFYSFLKKIRKHIIKGIYFICYFDILQGKMNF